MLIMFDGDVLVPFFLSLFFFKKQNSIQNKNLELKFKLTRNKLVLKIYKNSRHILYLCTFATNIFKTMLCQLSLSIISRSESHNYTWLAKPQALNKCACTSAHRVALVCTWQTLWNFRYIWRRVLHTWYATTPCPILHSVDNALDLPCLLFCVQNEIHLASIIPFLSLACKGPGLVGSAPEPISVFKRVFLLRTLSSENGTRSINFNLWTCKEKPRQLMLTMFLTNVLHFMKRNPKKRHERWPT